MTLPLWAAWNTRAFQSLPYHEWFCITYKGEHWPSSGLANANLVLAAFELHYCRVNSRLWSSGWLSSGPFQFSVTGFVYRGGMEKSYSVRILRIIMVYVYCQLQTYDTETVCNVIYNTLTLKAPSKSAADIFIFIIFLGKIRLDISCELSP